MNNNNEVPENIKLLAEDVLKLHKPDQQSYHHESSCRKCNSTEIDTVIEKLREENEKLNLQITALHKVIEGAREAIDQQKQLQTLNIDNNDKLKELFGNSMHCAEAKSSPRSPLSEKTKNFLDSLI